MNEKKFNPDYEKYTYHEIFNRVCIVVWEITYMFKI